jgi:hypothetical protein
MLVLNRQIQGTDQSVHSARQEADGILLWNNGSARWRVELPDINDRLQISPVRNFRAFAMAAACGAQDRGQSAKRTVQSLSSIHRNFENVLQRSSRPQRQVLWTTSPRLGRSEIVRSEKPCQGAPPSTPHPPGLSCHTGRNTMHRRAAAMVEHSGGHILSASQVFLEHAEGVSYHLIG